MTSPIQSKTFRARTAHILNKVNQTIEDEMKEMPSEDAVEWLKVILRGEERPDYDPTFGDPLTSDEAITLLRALLTLPVDESEQFKAEPEPTLKFDGTYEYTVTSDCDGSNVKHYRRTPRYSATRNAGEWETYTQ